MSKHMAELKAKAAKVISHEKAFDTKEKALAEAMKQCRNLDENISVWKAPDDMGGKYTIVQFENREEAFLCGYTEEYGTAELFDKVKEQRGSIDNIEEV